MTACSTKNERRTENPEDFREKILDWYDRHRRVLPWRALNGHKPNPYHVWISEIMLQQTTVTAVIPYFNKFTQLWPSVYDLAKADINDVMAQWAGLGYYARARNLHKCANEIVDQHDGSFPADQKALIKLSGIGDYTSAAITAIAFDKPANVVDGNIERIMARYHACGETLPKGKGKLKELAGCYSVDFRHRPGDYAQALMDLGATICKPKSPICALCPINGGCVAYAQGETERFPVKATKKKKSIRYGYVYWAQDGAGRVLLHKRPPKGLLGGMYGLPTSEWVGKKSELSHVFEVERTYKGDIEHIFTHFHLKLTVYEIKLNSDEKGEWVDLMDLDKEIFPTVFKKAVSLFK